MSFTQEENNLREERDALRALLRPLNEKAQRGDRLSFKERSAVDKMTTDLGAILLRLREFEDARAMSVGSWYPGPAEEEPNEAREKAFSAYIRKGTLSKDLTEYRAAGESTNTAGGYLVPPGWWQRLQVALKAYGGTASAFQQLNTDTGQPMAWATVDPTSVVGTLLAENTQIGGQDYVFGQGTLGSFMYTGGVQLVSLQLAQDSAFNIDQFVQARVGESLGRAIANVALNGTGSSQPLGIYAALNAKGSAGTVGGAITATGGYLQMETAQAVNVLSQTPGTAGTGTVTELAGNIMSPRTVLSMIQAVDPAYRALGAAFFVSDQMLQSMRAIVDGFSRPYYASLVGASPTLHGYPVIVDNNISPLTASTISGPVFGHLQSAMVLRSVNGAGILRLTERYADYLQVGYIGFRRIDIRSNDLRAAVVLKPAAT